MISYQILKLVKEMLFTARFIIYHRSVSKNYMIGKKIVFNPSNDVNTALRIFQVITVSLKVARIAQKYFLLQQHCVSLRKKI